MRLSLCCIFVIIFFMKRLLFLLLPIFLQAQNENLAIGQWKSHLSYAHASLVIGGDNKIYCLADKNLFYIDKRDNSIQRLSKVSGLSDVKIDVLAYSEEINALIIGYENCNIDIIIRGRVINISDIRRKEISGEKKINHIAVFDKKAYVSCSFGLVVINIEREEIEDTYEFYENEDVLKINACDFDEQNIYVATSSGVYYIDRYSPVVFDYSQWNKVDSLLGSVKQIKISMDTIVFRKEGSIINSINFCNNVFIETYDSIINIFDSKMNYVSSFSHEKANNCLYSFFDNEGNLWVADQESGILKFQNENYITCFKPDGPAINDMYSISFIGNRLYMCHGGHYNFSPNKLNYDGFSIKDDYDEWLNYDYGFLGNARDILHVAKDGSKLYLASYYDGVCTMEEGVFTTKYGYANTNGVLDTISHYPVNNRIRVSNIVLDQNKNLWGLSSEVSNPIFVKTQKNDEWYSFSINQSVVGLFFDDLLVDSWGHKWGVIGRGGGIFVFDEGESIENTLDERYLLLNTGTGSGNLPSLNVYSIKEDLDGKIWVGTDKGLVYFDNQTSIFDSPNYDAQEIIIQEGDYGQYLLSFEKINCIDVDGANRKWIGTESGGLFVLSDDGEEEVYHFTSDNSPLFSNNIVDITINQVNGEVFVGTSEGLLSYKGDAIEASNTKIKAKIFPNPVKENYNGIIAIDNLLSNTNVKITDINGNLVYETISKGGRAVWNGFDLNNNRVSTGIYMVFGIDINGQETSVGKIAFIR